ncbi:hypothetical protein G7085_01875 [Tessaracoccus sp. HDW20]|uniref:hypothetical protein n=1 Tax=Tessaracoccus coleopterorum TaxID=2714950 RepID=UPI0018D28C06|nr:hypothetical protein [Tessaracoccus coleopterorum]NHB83855.1 hypothetical protein [Tessaracoccus coleopterorum]
MHRAIPVGEREALEHAALHLGLAALIERIEADAEQRSQFELLDDCISGRAVPGAPLRARMERHGVDPRRPLVVLAVRTALRVPDALACVRRAVQAPRSSPSTVTTCARSCRPTAHAQPRCRRPSRSMIPPRGSALRGCRVR